MSTFPLENESARFRIKCANSSVPSRLLDDEHHWGDYLPWLWQSFQRCKSFQETLSKVPQYVPSDSFWNWSSFINLWPLLQNIKGDGDDRNFHLTRNSLMSPWPVRMVRWWKPTKWSWLAPVTNKPSLAGKGWGFLKCFGRTEECWHQNWVYAGFLLATLYTSWTVCRPFNARIFFILPFFAFISSYLHNVRHHYLLKKAQRWRL